MFIFWKIWRALFYFVTSILKFALFTYYHCIALRKWTLLLLSIYQHFYSYWLWNFKGEFGTDRNNWTRAIWWCLQWNVYNEGGFFSLVNSVQVSSFTKKQHSNYVGLVALRDLLKFDTNNFLCGHYTPNQPAFTSSKLAIEAVEQGMKSV